MYTPFILATCLMSCQAEETKLAPKADPSIEQSSSKSISLFDGESLEGWKVVNPKNARFWSVKNGVIEASNGEKKMPINTYLATTEEYGDFEFTCEFRLSGDHETGLINSGIQYRSFLTKGGKKGKKGGLRMVGYQADIGKGWWGGIYDEHRRNKLVTGDAKTLLASEGFKDDGWHHYKIHCKGDRHQLFINGILTADYTEKDPNIPAKGVIALQLHKGGIAKIEYRKIMLKPL